MPESVPALEEVSFLFANAAIREAAFICVNMYLFYFYPVVKRKFLRLCTKQRGFIPTLQWPVLVAQSVSIASKSNKCPFQECRTAMPIRLLNWPSHNH